MSLEGGHWVWSASLRYAFMILFLTIFLSTFKGIHRTRGIFRLFLNNWKFWTITGSIGFGGFYSLICFSADHSPGWVVAATWQLTIIATLIVLVCFGRSFPKKVWLFSTIIFMGVLMVNLSRAELSSFKELLMGGLPVLIAAFCYPIGNQLVWEVQNGNPCLPKINDTLVENPFNKVLLLSLGSLPFGVILVAVTRPPLPSVEQIFNTTLVAFFSGILATALFLMACHKAGKPSELAAVDATQSSEVVFAMIGEIWFLNAPLPDRISLMGISLVFVGLILFICCQEADGDID